MMVFNLACPASPFIIIKMLFTLPRQPFIGALNLLDLERPLSYIAGFYERNILEIHPLIHPQTEDVNPVVTRIIKHRWFDISNQHITYDSYS